MALRFLNAVQNNDLTEEEFRLKIQQNQSSLLKMTRDSLPREKEKEMIASSSKISRLNSIIVSRKSRFSLIKKSSLLIENDHSPKVSTIFHVSSY